MDAARHFAGHRIHIIRSLDQHIGTAGDPDDRTVCVCDVFKNCSAASGSCRTFDRHIRTVDQMEYRAELRIGALSRGECKPVVCCHIALAVNHIRRTEPAVFHQEGTARLPDQTCGSSGEFHPLHGDVAEDQIVSIRHGCTVGARLCINDGTCGIADSGAVGNFENRTVNLGPP